MKTAIRLTSISALLCCLPVAAQQSAPSAAGSAASLEERFKRFDRDGDGKVTRGEAPQLPIFSQWDANQDGAITLDEIRAFYQRRSRATKPSPPDSGKPWPSPPRAAIGQRTGDAFFPDAPIVGEINGSYIDPEFSETASQVVFQDVNNSVWIGDIDPETGLFKTATGRDYLMDENITLIFDRPPQGRNFSTNGPEWTRDAKGHCVVYTKGDKDGIMQQWMARLVNGKSEVTQLTHNKLDSYGNMPSRFMDGKPPRIAYTYDWPIWKAKAAWIFVDKPNEPHQLEGFDYRQMSIRTATRPAAFGCLAWAWTRRTALSAGWTMPPARRRPPWSWSRNRLSVRMRFTSTTTSSTAPAGNTACAGRARVSVSLHVLEKGTDHEERIRPHRNRALRGGSDNGVG
jgi:hypothetical protein